MPKERGDSGQYVETVTLADVLDVFDEVDGPPVVTTADVAEATGLSKDSARRKLQELTSDGRVDRRESAGRILYWRIESEVEPDFRQGHGALKGTDFSEHVDEVSEELDRGFQERQNALSGH